MVEGMYVCVCVCVCMYPKGLRCGLCRVGIHGVYVNLPITKVKTRDGRDFILLLATGSTFEDTLEAKNLRFLNFERFTVKEPLVPNILKTKKLRTKTKTKFWWFS